MLSRHNHYQIIIKIINHNQDYIKANFNYINPDPNPNPNPNDNLSLNHNPNFNPILTPTLNPTPDPNLNRVIVMFLPVPDTHITLI